MGGLIRATIAVAMALALATAAQAAPRAAAYVMDARSGEPLFAQNADERLHPASLTKMMTLYLVFEAIERGRLDLDQSMRVSPAAAAQPASKMGFRVGERIVLRDLVRAAAIRSANDSAVMLAEAVSGSEQRFAELMTQRARDLGMARTTFRNASGLTASGHLSTARDMAVLGRRLMQDFPQYYSLFGRQSAKAHGRTIANTNRLLSSYRGADGIKTGFTQAAGFNLVSSAQRGEVRVIASVFGGRSGAQRNARVAELLDLGFERAPAKARGAPAPALVAQADAEESAAPPTPRPDARPDARRDAAEPAGDALAQDLAEGLAAGAQALGEALSPAAAQAAEGPAEVPVAAPVIVAATRYASLRSAPPAHRPVTGGEWSLRLGAYRERDAAVANLAAAALGAMPELADAGREIDVTRRRGASLYRASLTGLDRETARAACAMIVRAGKPCEAVATN